MVKLAGILLCFVLVGLLMAGMVGARASIDNGRGDGDCPADVNADGVVDKIDLDQVLKYWGTQRVGEKLSADVNADGFVDVEDEIEVMLNWGVCGDDEKDDIEPELIPEISPCSREMPCVKPENEKGNSEPVFPQPCLKTTPCDKDNERPDPKDLDDGDDEDDGDGKKDDDIRCVEQGCEPDEWPPGDGDDGGDDGNGDTGDDGGDDGNGDTGDGDTGDDGSSSKNRKNEGYRVVLGYEPDSDDKIVPVKRSSVSEIMPLKLGGDSSETKVDSVWGNLPFAFVLLIILIVILFVLIIVVSVVK